MSDPPPDGDLSAECKVAADFLAEHGFGRAAEYLRGLAGGKVYVLTSGEYSSYAVEGVFSTREKAEAYLEAAAETGSFNDPDELDLDGEAGKVPRPRWSSSVRLADGRPLRQGRERPAMALPSERGYADAPILARGSNPDPMKEWVTAVSYVSQGHADELAAEARQKWLREKAGV